MSNLVVHSRTQSTSLRKGLRILSLFTREKPEWRVSEMSVAIGSAKSTVSRIAHTLEMEKFLTRNGQRDAYRLTLKLWELGSLVVTDSGDFPVRARPHLDTLVSLLDESAHAAIFDDLEVIYVDRVDAPKPLRTSMPVGARFPCFCTATGKAILAFKPSQVVDRIVRRGLKAFTIQTMTRPELLKGELDRIRKRGYAATKGEWREDIGGVAAPVFDRTAHVIGAIGVTMPTSHLTREKSTEAAKAVIQVARKLSAELGFLPGKRATEVRVSSVLALSAADYRGQPST